ncbi:hypothetical protein M948_09235 [Virgibacillus sp. CM-4]|uniref:S8 family serine peptidase n=1 Tax=Virgibacillus sp. CM-4 TaxID=1354277 RepID=UPI0003882694|nr:S8 family serine peptidase [Virgibacillus sp. CM-4]EQB37062.1 hypothetical protein M948_09235 [Virgibacillus sp. CM-4]
MKKLFLILLMFILLLSGFVSPVSAKFDLSTENQNPAKKLDAAISNDLYNQKDGAADTIYNNEFETIDSNESVRVIIEADINKKSRTTPEVQVERLKQALTEKKKSASQIIHTFSKGFYGFSMEMTRKQAKKIQDMDGVKDIRIAQTYEHMDVESNKLVEAMKVWQEYNYTGDGMVVAVVDSGIDYEHASLKLSEEGREEARYNEDNIQSTLDETKVEDVWYNSKVPTGYDWADQDTEVTPASDSHGTHVAGIVGAFDESGDNAIGVAPDVQLIAEKVFSDSLGIAYDDDIAAGIYHAVEVGADVINLSLGTGAGSVNSENPVQRAVEYATDQGVLVVAAAGNASYSTEHSLTQRPQLPLADNPDIGLVGAPGVTPSALQVASSENDKMKVDALLLNDGSKLGYQTQYTSQKLVDELEAGKEYELIFTGEGFGDDLDGLDLEGKIAVAQPNQSYSIYSPLQRETKDKGGVAVLMAPPNNYPAYSQLRFSQNTIPAVTLDHNTSAQLIERLKNGEKIKAKVIDDRIWVENPVTEPMSDFSSYGSPTDLSFKPEVTAPGGQISSTVLNSQYETMSGTSMASPHVAAGGALLLEKYYEDLNLPKNEASVLKAKTALMNTSQILTNPNHDNTPYSPRRQGSGLMKIGQAIQTSYIVKHVGAPAEKAASVALKEVDRSFDFTLDVEPLAKKREKANHQYNIVVDVLTDETAKKTENGVEREYLTLNSIPVEDAIVKINGKKVQGNKKFQYKPKRDDEVTISVELPEELSENRFVEGFVRFVPKGSSVKDLTILTVPFMGFYGEWDSLDNIDKSPINGDAYLGYTVLWNDMLSLPLGYDAATDSFNEKAVGYSPDAIPNGILPSFTSFRNLKEMSLKIEDEEGNTISHVSDFSEYSADGQPLEFKKNIMSQGDYYYKFDGVFWSGKDDEGNTLPNGKYYYVYQSVLDYEGAEPQKTKIPFYIDSAEPEVDNIQFKKQEDGTYKITWDVKEEGSGYLGSFLWINGELKKVDQGVTEFISEVEPETVMISAIDNLRNVGVGYKGDEDQLTIDPFVNFMNIRGTNVNENTPAKILIFGYQRMDWHIEISNSDGDVIEYVDIKNEHSIYNLEWYAGPEYQDGNYYVTVTGTDEKGLSLTSEPKKITVKH